MNFTLLTLFPDIFKGFLAASIQKRAIDQKQVKVNIVNIRDFAKDQHKTVDDKPYGGGKGMVMRVDVLMSAIESLKPKPYLTLLSASGRKYDQKIASILVRQKNIALVCGRYEGVDARVEKYVDDIISIGDFVLTGGEIAAMAIIDSVTRLIPGVIKEESIFEESFSTNHSSLATHHLLEYPQYTRPDNYHGLAVPPVLLSGNHQEIRKWREEQSLKRTKKYRPDLLK